MRKIFKIDCSDDLQGNRSTPSGVVELLEAALDAEDLRSMQPAQQARWQYQYTNAMCFASFASVAADFSFSHLAQIG
ncbi:hypothetical protein GX50_06181 [[Emmonsia] crescens]|uniref:Uncharacterized protein n=1 Tax=[Emmonsia] crescens TaxID=73230 RepID=A0A2B7ZD08_9EURO|nr:hypothetical protein GX50_06181 [Emmonsia crescens]